MNRNVVFLKEKYNYIISISIRQFPNRFLWLHQTWSKWSLCLQIFDYHVWYKYIGRNKICKVLKEWKVFTGWSLLAFARSQKKLKIRFQLVKGFYHIVANVRLPHSSSDRYFGSEVLKYEIWNEWSKEPWGKCVGM